MMIAFIVFFALIIAFLVVSVHISMRFYSSRRATHGEELIQLSQEASIEERRSGQLRRNELDMGMAEFVRRVSGMSLLIVAVIVILITAFFSLVH